MTYYRVGNRSHAPQFAPKRPVVEFLIQLPYPRTAQAVLIALLRISTNFRKDCTMINRTREQLGKYRLVSLLGKGSFAEVYLGTHVLTGKQAAIKVLDTQLVSEADTEAFITEARRVSNLDHSHIVGILDFDVEGGVPFLVMTYASLGTLRQRYRKGSPPSLSTAVSYVKQIADALHYAHGQGLIHCDIKPENILLKKEDEVLVSDFGIAEIAHATYSMPSPKTVVLGTPAYMAPEQFGGWPRPAS